jgi:hypothetical protein
MFNLGKKYTMSRFKYPIPEIIRPLLIVKNITSVEKLIDYVEKHPMKFVQSMYADFLWKNDVEKELFFFYQKHVNEGKLPFLLNFPYVTRRKFLRMGVYDEESLIEFTNRYRVSLLLSQDHPMYDFVYELMSDEAKENMRFFDSFSTGTKNVLKHNGVHKKADLMDLIAKTNLIDVPRIGKVAREEILRYLERDFYDQN